MKIAAPAKLKEKTLISYIVNAVGSTTDTKLFLSSASTINELKAKLKVYENYFQKETAKNKTEECIGCGSSQHKIQECPKNKNGPHTEDKHNTTLRRWTQDRSKRFRAK